VCVSVCVLVSGKSGEKLIFTPKAFLYTRPCNGWMAIQRIVFCSFLGEHNILWVFYFKITVVNNDNDTI